MKLSEVHQDLLKSTANGKHAKGYVVPEGEEGHFHIMFVDIIGGKGIIGVRKAIFQKYFPKEWDQSLKAIEKYGITITGHNEFAVLHDPTEVKPEPKQKPGPKPEQKSNTPQKS